MQRHGALRSLTGENREGSSRKLEDNRSRLTLGTAHFSQDGKLVTKENGKVIQGRVFGVRS